MATASVSWEQYQAQQAETRLKLQNKGDRNFGEPAWKKRMNNFDPKGVKSWVRVRPDWFLYYAKWYGVKGSKRFVISNSHNGELSVPDLVFYNAEQRGDPKLLASRNVVATTTILEAFHEIERPNKDPKKKGYVEYVRCDGTDQYNRVKCERCKTDVKKVFGQQKHWSMSPRSKDELEEDMYHRLSMCLHCCVGTVVAVMYSCGLCKSVILDRYKEEVTDEDAATLESAEGITCPHCAKNMVPVCTYECSVAVGGGYEKGCSNPTPVPKEAGIYDLEYLIEQDPADYSLNISKFRLQQSHPDLPRNMLEGLDLPSFFSYMSLEEQSKGLGIPNPFGAEGEKAVEEYFRKQAVTAVSSSAAPEEADASSIPWNKK